MSLPQAELENLRKLSEGHEAREMKSLKRKTFQDSEIRHPEDVAKIKRALNAAGYDASDADIQWAYECLSDEGDVGWWSLNVWDTESAMVQQLLNYLEPQD